MFPAVSSGPLDPAWSPDGKWIAFSMRGDIWKISPDGGEAIALTSGPNYYFEPAWSPDWRRIALTMKLHDAPPAKTAPPRRETPPPPRRDTAPSTSMAAAFAKLPRGEGHRFFFRFRLF